MPTRLEPVASNRIELCPVGYAIDTVIMTINAHQASYVDPCGHAPQAGQQGLILARSIYG